MENNIEENCLKERGNIEQMESPVYKELNLMEVILLLLKNKFLIFGMTLTLMITSIIFSLLMTPKYEATAIFLPPHHYNLVELQIQGVYKVAPGTVFSEFQNQLKSIRLRNVFFRKKNLIQYYGVDNASSEKLIEKYIQIFTNSLKLKSKGRNQESVFLSFRFKDPSTASKLLSDFVSMAEDVTIQLFLTDAQLTLQKKIKELENEVFSKQKMAVVVAKDNLAELSEALTIAEKLKLKNSIDVNLRSNQKNESGINVMLLDGNSAPLYLRGTEALSAEIKVLQERKDYDRFIPELRDLKTEIIKLRSYKFNRNALKVDTVDQPPKSKAQPVFPNRLLFALVGGFGGLMASLVIVFFKSYLAMQQNREI